MKKKSKKNKAKRSWTCWAIITERSICEVCLTREEALSSCTYNYNTNFKVRKVKVTEL
jgi:hypothetical protein